MAEFTEVMKHRNRMCKNCNFIGGQCVKCLGHLKNMIMNPKESQDFIMKWASENPIKTNADKFKEVFGFEPYTDLCILEKSIKCNECEYKRASGDGTCCSKWWNQEYKEPKEVD